MAYTYRSIANNEIRLLKVLPRAGAEDKTLRFSLRHFARQRAPQYEAISYTWGKETTTELIWVDDEKFFIRSNLWECLYFLTIRNDRPYLWVDAICINQSDMAEKSRQVSRMGETFSSAKRVCAWLGAATEASEALDVTGTSYWYRFGYMRNLVPLQKAYLADLINRPYWKRAWVVQEFLLANDLLLCYGKRAVNWQRLRDLLRQAILLRPTECNWMLRSHASALLHGRRTGDWVRHTWSLETLLQSHQSVLCEDPRDKVFSLLSLLPEGHEGSNLRRIFPDYRRSLGDVMAITLYHVLYHRTYSNAIKFPWKPEDDLIKDTVHRAPNVLGPAEPHALYRTVLTVFNSGNERQLHAIGGQIDYEAVLESVHELSRTRR